MRQLLPVLLALVLLPSALGHVTVTSVAPAGPVLPGQPATVAVTLSVLCPVVLAEYAQTTEFQLALVPTAAGVDPPAYLPFVGDVVPSFSVPDCDPTTVSVQTGGNIVITPSPLAPAFTPVELQPGAVGETNEGGAFTLAVGYRAFLANVSAVAIPRGTALSLPLDVTANADTVLLVEAPAGLDVQNEVEVASPLLAGVANRTAALALTAAEAGIYTLTVTPVAKADRSIAGRALEIEVTVTAPAPVPAAPAAPTAPVTFPPQPPAFSVNVPTPTRQADPDGKDAPGPAPVLLLTTLAAVAVALRRRLA